MAVCVTATFRVDAQSALDRRNHLAPAIMCASVKLRRLQGIVTAVQVYGLRYRKEICVTHTYCRENNERSGIIRESHDLLPSACFSLIPDRELPFRKPSKYYDTAADAGGNETASPLNRTITPNLEIR
jgi:hypothetical protein